MSERAGVFFTLEPLVSPVAAHGETLTAIRLSKPSGVDVREVGALPYVMGEDGVNLNTKAAMKYISRLAAIPPSSVDQIDIADLNELMWAVANFFLDKGGAALKTLQPGSTTSPGSGGSTLN
ncbi:phage tail assembly protein [Paraburkholderia susongensis]|uniref:Phage tail assembly chaperone protein, E, or 41 or 14 n=1 Tax=Paraburkholderia susongensis TaxID=1515439 RepID=A0A1X7I5S5_9BURK|nr:phage tail assembly protein [Paraburkholderia susongensis]SMG09449.1 Phage tail assembly chaperone protein, E, or 41 or 14 [Paraburkholderia susongensis]